MTDSQQPPDRVAIRSDDPGRPRDRLSRLLDRVDLAWMAAIPPAALLGVLILNNAVDMPFWDDWKLISETLIRARSGDLGFWDLAAQYNNSRPLFPRILFLVVGIPAQGDGRWLLLVTFSLACAVSYSVFVLARGTVKTWRLWALMLLSGLLIFSPMHAESWLMGSYIGLEPIACLAASLALLRSRIGPGTKVAMSGALCTIATFSYANGLANWVLVVPVLVASVGWRWLAWWTLGFGLNLGAFLHGYAAPAHSSLGLEPLRLAHYLVVFLGAPLGLGRMKVAAAMGTLLLLLAVLVVVYLATRWDDRDLQRRAAPWLSLGGYALLSGLAAGLGRSSLGTRQALANRYLPFSLYLTVALLFLVPMVLEDARARGLLPDQRRRLVLVPVVAGFASCLALELGAVVVGARGMEWVGRMQRYGKSCLLFINVHPDVACLSTWVYPDTGALHGYANALDRLGYLRPELVETERLGNLAAPGPAGRRDSGTFESLRDDKWRFVAAGWAGLPTAPRPADSVILARQEDDGVWVPLIFVPVLEPRPDVAAAHGLAYRRAGWRAGLPKDQFPPWPTRVGAWALDADRAQVFPLVGTHTAEGHRESPVTPPPAADPH